MSRWPPRTCVGQLLAVLLVEQRLVVEQILLRRAAGLEEVDDPLDPRREVQARRETVGRHAGGRGGAGEAGRSSSEFERKAANAGRRRAEEMAAGDARQIVEEFGIVHGQLG